jgi:AbrB family looped-hinge helix DNA binding protein
MPKERPLPNVKLLKGGRITVPKALRDQLGWGGGTKVQIEYVNGELKLRRVK